jgi:hypothetical protein
MRPKLLLAIGFVVFSITAQAQTTTTDTNTPVLSKEEKAAKKLKAENDLAEAIKKLGLTAEEGGSLKKILDDAGKANYDLKARTDLTEEQKAAEKKKITDDKNEKLKTLLGAEKYRQWNAIRKEQKEKAAGVN